MKNKKIKFLCSIVCFIVTILLIIRVNAVSLNNMEVEKNYVRSTNNTTDNLNDDVYSDIASDTSVAASPINRILSNAITICSMISLIGGAFLLIKGIINLKKKKTKSGLVFLVCSVVLLAVNYVLSIIKSFKPIIYIYPEEETEVNVKLGKKEKLTCTYPKYENEWKVKAKPNGDLVDLKTGRNLYALYWEGLNTNKQKFEEGFVVKGEEIAKFLEEKLEILGLNEREAEEFIIYWLPQMEHNKYNYVRFETIDEINENMPLEITPKPETLIRINMVFKPLRRIIDIKEQELKSVKRNGYTVVEWGGSKL